jgi:hypothetical protein
MFRGLSPKILLLGIVLILLVGLGSSAAINERVVTVTIDGITVTYSEEIILDKEGFEKELGYYLDGPAGYLRGLADETSARWMGIEAEEWRVSHQTQHALKIAKTTYSYTLLCTVHKAITKTQDKYTATFRWLLDPFGLDFIDDQFTELNHGLFWAGEIEGIPTSLTVEAPPRDSAYAAWHQPNGHCHKHLWWREQP